VLQYTFPSVCISSTESVGWVFNLASRYNIYSILGEARCDNIKLLLLCGRLLNPNRTASGKASKVSNRAALAWLSGVIYI
jgi:hypothetical protein